MGKISEGQEGTYRIKVQYDDGDSEGTIFPDADISLVSSKPQKGKFASKDIIKMTELLPKGKQAFEDARTGSDNDHQIADLETCDRSETKAAAKRIKAEEPGRGRTLRKKDTRPTTRAQKAGVPKVGMRVRVKFAKYNMYSRKIVKVETSSRCSQQTMNLIGSKSIMTMVMLSKRFIQSLTFR